MSTGLVRSLGRVVSTNTPVILAGTAVVGVIGTAYLAVVGDRAARLRCEELDLDTSPSLRDYLSVSWDLYIPAAVAGAATISAVVALHTVGAKRTAVATAATALTKDAYDRYRYAVEEIVPVEQRQQIRSKAAERIKLPENRQNVVLIEGGTVLCFDAHSGRYFRSSTNHLRRVENELNATIINESSVSLNEFYERVGLPTNAMGDQLGWKLGHQIELQFTTRLSESEEPCVVVDFIVEPIPDWFKLS